MEKEKEREKEQRGAEKCRYNNRHDTFLIDVSAYIDWLTKVNILR